MKQNAIRKGISQARLNENAVNILFGEIIITSIALGLLTKSWWIFGLVFLGSTIGLRFKKFAFILCSIFVLCWTLIGYFIGTLFSNISASIVLAIIGLFLGIGANFAAVQWVKDVGDV